MIRRKIAVARLICKNSPRTLSFIKFAASGSVVRKPLSSDAKYAEGKTKAMTLIMPLFR